MTSLAVNHQAQARRTWFARLAEWTQQAMEPQWSYIARSVLAAVLAYALAYALQLETPYSAANTVLLVTHMNHGVVLAKGGWRLMGTMIGGLVAVVLMGFLVQAPVLFLVGFGLWLALCSIAATVLRHFRAVGAAVAGYTVGFATYGALEAPERALSAVLGRTATVAVGVACLWLVTSLLSRRATSQRLRDAFRRQVIKTGEFIGARLDDAAGSSPRLDPSLVAAMFSMDDLLEQAKSESTTVSASAGWIREGIASLFGAALGAAELSVQHPGPGATFTRVRAQVLTDLPAALRLFGDADASDALAVAALARLRHLIRDALAAAEVQTCSAGELLSLELLLEVLEDLESAAVSLMKFEVGRPHRAEHYRFNRDWNAALTNGARSFIGVVAAGLFGFATGWQDWSTVLLLFAPYSVILATTGNPVAGAASFVKGTLLGILPAFFCATLLIPHIQGFPLLMLTLAPFWIGGLYATTKPATAFAGLAFLVTFNTLIGTTNPFVFDVLPGSPLVFSVQAFFNKALGWMGAVIATWLSLKLLFPHAPYKQARRIAQAIQADVRTALDKGHKGSRRVWEHLQHHRLAGVALHLKADPDRAALMLDAGLGAVHIGRTALRLHAMLRDRQSPYEVRSLALEALAIARSSSPSKAQEFVALQLRAKAFLPQGTQALRQLHRIQAAITDLDDHLRRHGGWLTSNPSRSPR